MSSGFSSGNPVQTAGVNDVYEYNEVHVASRHRDAGSNDHPRWDVRPELHNVMGCKVLSAQIPFSYRPVVDSGPGRNNRFAVEVDGAIYTPYVTQIPAGAYTPQQLADAVNAASAAAWTATWHADTQRMELYLKVYSASAQPRVRWDLEPQAAALFGFAPELLTMSGTNKSIFATAAPQLAGPNSLYLASDALGGRVSRNVRFNGSSSPNPPVIANVPVDVNVGEVICYRDPNPAPCFDVSMDMISRLDFYLLDGNTLQEVDMQGAPWNVTLQVLTQRDTSVTRFQAQEVGRKRLRVQ